MRSGRPRILWLATADARGHLMRCQLLARALGARGFDVDVVTTSREGQAFLREFGVEAALLSEHYRVEFDGRQNMKRLGTEWRLIRYFTSPGRFWRDRAWLIARARGASLVVNDSFHPALLVCPRLGLGPLPPVVHIYGSSLRVAFEENFSGRVPSFIASVFRRGTAWLTDGAFARIEHRLGASQRAEEIAPRTFRLPPVVAAPTRSRSEVRRSLQVAADQRLVVAYLNPHFRDVAIARALEEAAQSPGAALHAVGEGFAGRQGWHATDPLLADALAAADVIVSAPGAGALAQATGFGVPLLALITDQPEQRLNLERLRSTGHPFEAVALADTRLADRLSEALGRLMQLSPERREPTNSLEPWVTLLEALCQQSSDLQEGRT